jgi:hypothetical protein
MFPTDTICLALAEAGFSVTLADDGPHRDRDRFVGVLGP